MDGAGRRAERDRDGEGDARWPGRGVERRREDGARGWIRESRTGGVKVSERSEQVGRWLDRAQAVLGWTVAVALLVCVYFATYFAAILMEAGR